MMDNLNKQLQSLGFSKELIISINEAEQFEKYDISIDNLKYQSFDKEIISSTELKVNQAPKTCTNLLIENCD